jgi:Chaperone of endosialidase
MDIGRAICQILYNSEIISHLKHNIMKIKYLPQLLLVILFIVLQEKTFAQVGINSSNAAPDPVSMLDVSSTSKGLLIPRMTTAQRMAIVAVEGLTVYDITTKGFWYFNGGGWVAITTGPSSLWLTNGTDIYNTNGTGYVGIGISTPTAPLTVYNSGSAHTLYLTSTTGTTGNDGFFVGNSNFQVSGTGYILNQENAPIIFGTNNAEKMRMEANGLVGIGINTPASPLHVVSNAVNNYTLPAPFVYTSNNASTFVSNNTVYNASPNVGVMGASVGTGMIGTGQKTSFNIGVAGFGNAGANAVGVYGSASAGTSNYGVYCNGSGGYTGTWTLLSDIRFKEKITNLEDDILTKVMQLKPSNYALKTEEYKSMNFPKTRQFGFIAQDLEQVFPTLVEKTSSMNIGNSSTENKTEPIDYKVVNYIGMIPILTKAIQEQQEIIKSQQSQIDALKKSISNQQNQINAVLNKK